MVSADEPKIEDFGITDDEYAKVKRKYNPWSTLFATLALIIAVASGLFIDGDIEGRIGLGLGIFIGLGIVGLFIGEFLMKRSSLYRRVKLYQEALNTFYQKQKDYWLSLKGENLEYITADLYRKLGYEVKDTPRTNDKGIDLFLRKNGTTIVQCKGHKNPVGPAVVRELYGTLKSSNASSAILVSPAGFTKGAKQTALGKDIQLISSYELIAMAKELEQPVSILKKDAVR